MSTTKWVIDPTHSEVGFSVKHMMFTKVNGTFDDVEASIETEGDSMNNAKINATIQTASINTRNEQRDGHLISLMWKIIRPLRSTLRQMNSKAGRSRVISQCMV
jgi:polyisoprenoid-binding protein YceI